MSTIPLFTHTSLPGLTEPAYDDGLQHPHHWAIGHANAGRHNPIVARPAAVPTPSSVIHDDLHYAAA